MTQPPPDPSPIAPPTPRSTLNRRALLIGGGGLALLAAAALARKRAVVAESRALRVGRTGKGGYDLIMRLAGIESKHLKLQYSDFQSGHLQVEAFNGGSLDFGGMSEIPPVFAAASSVQSFKQIATVNADVNNQVVLVPGKSEIKTLADLKGKKVGYVRATTAQYFLIQMLASVGLTWNDIEPVSLSVPDGTAAFSRGSLDAWAIYGFPIQRALANDGARVLKTALGFLSGNYIVSAHVNALSDPVLSKAIGEYLGSYKRAFAWQNQHWQEWSEALAKEIDVPLPYVVEQVKGRSAPTTLLPVSENSIKSQQEVADVFFKAGLIPKRVDVRPLWDNRYNSIIEQVS